MLQQSLACTGSRSQGVLIDRQYNSGTCRSSCRGPRCCETRCCRRHICNSECGLLHSRTATRCRVCHRMQPLLNCDGPADRSQDTAQRPASDAKQHQTYLLPPLPLALPCLLPLTTCCLATPPSVPTLPRSFASFLRSRPGSDRRLSRPAAAAVSSSLLPST